MTRSRNKTVLLILFAVLASSMLLVLGCEEEDVPFVIDEDEIRAYLAQDAVAQELFRTGGLFPTEPYEIPFKNATYRDSVLSHQREITITMVPLKRPVSPGSSDSIPTPSDQLLADYGDLGQVREAWAMITDRFTVETTREVLSGTLVDTTDRRLRRYGLFLKLGDDRKPYVGWLLFGYNGNSGPLAALLRAPAGRQDTTFAGSFYFEDARTISAADGTREFRRLSELPRVDRGSVVEIETNWAGAPGSTIRDYPLIAVSTDSGYRTTTLARDTREHYEGSVDLRDSGDDRYNFFFMQSVHDDSFFPANAWVIPYRHF